MGGARCVFSPYDISHCLIEGYDVVVNRPKTAAYRALGTPAAAMAMETALDELAEKLGMDPLELRAKNTAREGPRRISGANGFYPTPASTTDSWASAGRSGGRNCSPGH
jgi:xanthine dehydrogenase molybdenum-binding subunit